MQDFVIADIAVHLAASKNAQYRANTLALFKSLGLFLQTQALTVRPLLAADADFGPTFKVMRSDLTDEGYELIKAGLHKWVKAVMAAKCPPTDCAILEKELRKLRERV